MALINLTYIEQLFDEADLNYDLVQSLSYNSKNGVAKMDDATFVFTVKAYVQAKNLLARLKSLRNVCVDLAAGNFEAYRNEHNNWELEKDEADRVPYMPFATLDACFNSMSVDDLPYQIEQYKELLTLSYQFAKTQEKRRQGLDRFFPGKPSLVKTIDDEGNVEITPLSDLPIEWQEEMTINRELHEIEVEHSLDNYNQFYEQATGLLANYVGGDIHKCATDILALYKK